MATITVILEPPKIKSATVSTVSPSICLEVMGPDAMILVFWMLSFKPIFSLFYFTFTKRLFSSSLLSAIRVVSSVYLRLLIFLPAILIPVCVASSPEFCTMYSAYMSSSTQQARVSQKHDMAKEWERHKNWKRGSGGQHFSDVKVPKLIKSALLYVFRQGSTSKGDMLSETYGTIWLLKIG